MALTDYFNSPELTQAQGSYNQAAQDANTSAAEDVSLPTQLREALATKFGENNPLVQQRETALKGYLDSIQSSYSDVLPQNNNGVILSPTQQAMMISSKQNAYLAPLSTSNYLLGLQTGGLDKIVEAAAAAHQGQTKLKISKADLAHQNAEDILTKLAHQADAAYKDQNLQLEKAKLASAKLGSLDDQRALAALQNDVSKNTTFRELYNRYAGVLPEYQIRDLYNSGPMAKKYGAAKEQSLDLMSDYATGKKSNASKDARHDSLQSALASLDSAENNLVESGGAKGPGGWPAKIPLLGQYINSSGASYEKTKIELATSLAKALTNSSRPGQDVIDKYMHSLPSVTDTPQHAADLLKKLRSELQTQAKSFKYNDLIKGSGGGSKTILMQAPDGSKYNVSADEIQEAKKNGWRQL